MQTINFIGLFTLDMLLTAIPVLSANASVRLYPFFLQRDRLT
ncbi:hypothetical protein [Nostoc sp. DedQUE09]|nr:hypothetical protein [Nostoc sp. DedQUE09]MDZ7955775.1 hypothetical protein [Nostoc sp. DedQUE09]